MNTTIHQAQAEEIRYLAQSYDSVTLSRRFGFSTALEAQFLHFFATRYAHHRAYALIFALLLFIFSATLDFFNAPQNWLALTLYKYLSGAVVVAVVVALGYSRLFHRHGQWLVMVALAILAGFLLFSAYYGNLLRFELYLPAVLVLILGAGLLPRLLLWQFVLLWLWVLALCNVVLWLANAPLQMALAYNLYGAVSGVMALFLSYFFERGARKQFINQRLLDLEKHQLGELSEALASLANIDPATGLGNLNHLHKSLDMEWYRAIRNHKPLSLLLVDIDYYSEIKATLGEMQAREVIVHVAKALEHTCKRAADLVARYDKDTFVLLLPETTLENASTLAARACAAVRDLALTFGSKTVTISIGQASFLPSEHQEASEIINKADAALYLAKRNGRDGYYVYHDE